MKLWKRWCKKVEEHNSRLGYGDYEEAWSPFTIFYPILLSSLIGFFVCAFSNSFTKELFIPAFLISAIILGIAYFINWKIYDK